MGPGKSRVPRGCLARKRETRGWMEKGVRFQGTGKCGPKSLDVEGESYSAERFCALEHSR